VARTQGVTDSTASNEEADTKRKVEAVQVAAANISAHLQRALSASSVPLLVDALAAADTAVALHPSLIATHSQVAVLRTEAHTRAATVAEEAIKEALALGNSTDHSGINTASAAALEAAIAGAESVPPPLSPAVESLRVALVNARRVAAYWLLRLRKADHTQWTCNEVVVAFTAVAHSNGLPADTIDAVIAYFKAELPDGSFLAEVGTDASHLTPIITIPMRRIRAAKLINGICAESKGSAIGVVSVDNDLSQLHIGNTSSALSVSSTAASAVTSESQPIASSSSSASSTLSLPSSSASASEPKPIGARLLLSDAEFELVTNPITGIISAPLLSLREAVRATGIKVPASCVELASEHHENMEVKCAHGLTADEIGAIHLYTQECPLYHELNALLRGRDRAKLKPCLPFMRLLVGAMHKLPKHAGRVFRGMTRHLADTAGDDKRGWPLDQIFPIGKKFVWWAASSTSLSMKTLEAFAGKVGRRTVFSISAKHAVDVMAYSAFGDLEKEWVLAPGAKLRVTGVADLGDVAMVELEEMGVPYTLMDWVDEQ
jgi:hypothetical protein